MFAESFLALASLLTVREARLPPTQTVVVQSLPVAHYVPGPQPPTKKDENSFGVETTARAAIVLDVASGEVLYEKDAETAYPIASLTKLVTAMTMLDQKQNMDEMVTILAEDDPKEGRPVFPEGEQFTRQDLLRALLVGSVNISGNALARTFPGGRVAFLAAMNAKAQKLGMSQAHFEDPTGLNSHNQASAHDVAMALRAALSYPTIRDITETNQITLVSHTTSKPYLIKSTNLLLGSFLNQDPYRIIAGKTGSLPEAGFCLAQATRNKEGHEVIAVVLDSENHFARFQDAKALTYWAFQSFEWPTKAVVHP
jgi:D-alanyl-D-alanine endopeptidase (penicillin-binding protein 7)